jgi:hypothetical protein
MGVFVVTILVVVVLVVLWFVFHGYAAAKADRGTGSDRAVSDPRTETLRYLVPDRQDPAVVMAALEKAGYPTAVEHVRAGRFVTVACPDGSDKDRSRIREIIGGADATSLEGPTFDPGPVTFEDEA